jgi:hypothetical protein
MVKRKIMNKFVEKCVFFFLLVDVGILCSVARDIANCTRQQLGDCIAAEVRK